MSASPVISVSLAAGKTYQIDAMGLSTGDGTLAEPAALSLD